MNDEVNLDAQRKIAEFEEWEAEYHSRAEHFRREAQDAHEVGDGRTAISRLQSAHICDAQAATARRFIADLRYTFEDVADTAIKTGGWLSAPARDAA